jgi:hypothetical protein
MALRVGRPNAEGVAVAIRPDEGPEVRLVSFCQVDQAPPSTETCTS